MEYLAELTYDKSLLKDNEACTNRERNLAIFRDEVLRLNLQEGFVSLNCWGIVYRFKVVLKQELALVYDIFMKDAFHMVLMVEVKGHIPLHLKSYTQINYRLRIYRQIP